MNCKKYKIIFASVLLICIIILIVMYLKAVSNITIIGGADYQTYAFIALRVVRSVEGAVVSGVGLLSLLIIILLSVRKGI